MARWKNQKTGAHMGPESTCKLQARRSNVPRTLGRQFGSWPRQSPGADAVQTGRWRLEGGPPIVRWRALRQMADLRLHGLKFRQLAAAWLLVAAMNLNGCMG